MKTLFAVLLVSSLIPPVAAQDDSTATAVYTIIALEKAWNQAFKFRDTRAMDILLDDGALLVNDDGSLQSKGEFLSGIRESKPSDEEQVTPESISVRIFGGVGIATGIPGSAYPPPQLPFYTDPSADRDSARLQSFPVGIQITPGKKSGRLPGSRFLSCSPAPTTSRPYQTRAFSRYHEPSTSCATRPADWADSRS